MSAEEFMTPSGDGGEGAADAGASGKSGGRAPINPSSVVLAGLFAAGIIGIYLLSLRGGPAEAAAGQDKTQTQVDSALSELAAPQVGGEANDAAMVDTLYYESSQRQIPLEALRSNPFVQKPMPAQEPVVKPEQPDEGAIVEPAAAEVHYAQALEEAKRLTLQTILTGKEPAAMINSNLLTEGQKIHGWTVSGIHPKEVELTWQDKKHVLRLP